MSIAILTRSTTAIMTGLSVMTYYKYQQVIEYERNLPKQTLQVFDDDNNNNNNNNKNNKKVIVIGAGVVGVATAYSLAQRGYNVAVLEPNTKSGQECSACAAGGMQRSNPVVDKQMWIDVTKCLIPNWLLHAIGQTPLSRYDFFHISWITCLSDPFFIRWLITFTKTSFFPPINQQEKQHDMLSFTNYAVQQMIYMLENVDRGKLGKQSGYNTNGSISVSYDEIPKPSDDKNNSNNNINNNKSTNNNNKVKPNPTQSKMNLEPYCDIIGSDAIIKIEPSLRYQQVLPTRAKFEYDAKSASSGMFAIALTELCERYYSQKQKWYTFFSPKNQNRPFGQVQFFYNTRVEGITTTTTTTTTSSNNNNNNINKNKNTDPTIITQLHTNVGIISCMTDNDDGDDDNNDKQKKRPIPVVVAAGAWIPQVLALMDMYVPVYPLKGYSMSINVKEALTLKNNDGPKKLSNVDLPSEDCL